MVVAYRLLRIYFFPLILLASILLGGFTGYYWKSSIPYIKPLGDIFLNLIYSIIVPLIFFSVSSAIVRASNTHQLGKIIFYMIFVFFMTSVIAAILTIFVVSFFPPAQEVYLPLSTIAKITPIHFSNNIVNIFTVSNFSKLFSHENIVALIIFSIITGLAVATLNKKENVFSSFLQSGEKVFMQAFEIIMYFAPIGFFSYFAVLVHDLGPELAKNYTHIAITYYLLSLIYFIVVLTSYAYLAGKKESVQLFWKNLFLPAATALATCSSAASIPANLKATQAMRARPEIYETVIPLGTMIHKEGSVMGGVIKIAFLFGLFHLNFSGASVLLTALGVSLLVGTVMGAIPSGGMLGELLILNIYGFPASALIAIAAISIIIDPPATVLNVMGNSVSSLLITRLVEGKQWLTRLD